MNAIDKISDGGVVMRARVFPSFLFVLSVFIASAPASADEPRADPTAAETLLGRGVEQMKAGRFDAACPLIEASQRIKPTPDTLYTLAECELQRGKIAGALEHYRQYLQLVTGMPEAQQDARVKNAQAQVAALEPEVPTLKLVVPNHAPPGVQVTRNARPVPATSFGVDELADPGEHVILTQLPNGTTIEQRIVLKKRDRKTLEVYIPPDAVKAEPDGAVTLARPWQRPVGIAVMAMGAPGIAVGSVMGMAAISKRNESNFGHCNAQDFCSAEGLELRKEAVSLASGSTSAIIIGSIFLAGGIVVFATAPRTPKQERRATRGVFDAHVEAGFGGVWLKGSW